MSEPTGSDRYDPVAQTLHWAVAFLIIGAYLIVQLIGGMPRGPEKAFWVGLHRSLGVTVFALVLARAAWRWINPPPAWPVDTPSWMVVAAKTGHGLLYALMLAVPLAGAAMTWTAGQPVVVFGLFELPTLMSADPVLRRTVRDVHELAGNGLIIVAGLHAAMALIHHYVLRDGTLGRMLPGNARGAGP